MPKVAGKTLTMVGYTEGIGYNGWAADMEANLRLTDTLLCGVVEQVLAEFLPSTPADGETYIIFGSAYYPSQANNVARYRAATTSWEYYVPKKGWKFWDNLTGSTWIYDGTQWAGTLSISNINASVVTASGYVNATEIRTSNSQRISSGGVGSFTGLTSTGGGTFAGGKVTLAPATTSYASFNVPVRASATTAKVLGDIWNTSKSLSIKSLGVISCSLASDTFADGAFLGLQDTDETPTKGWILQLGASNTLDFWNFSSSWSRKARMTPTGSIGRQQSSDVTAATTQTKTITLPAEDGLFELSLVATVNNANAYGIRAMRVNIICFSAYTYTAFAPIVTTMSDQSQFLTGTAPTVTVTSAVNGVITITVTGTGTKKLDTNLVKVCDSQPI